MKMYDVIEHSGQARDIDLDLRDNST